MGIRNEFFDTMDTGNGIKVLPREFTYKRFLLDEYTFDGDQQIIAKISFAKDLQSSDNEVHCTKADIFCKMLTLRAKLSDGLFASLQKSHFTHNCLNKDQIDTIVMWCKKNGYPFEIEAPQGLKQRKFKQLEAIETDYYVAHFNVLDFLKELDEVYGAFWLYRRITGIEDTVNHDVVISRKKPTSKASAMERVEYIPIPKDRDECIAIFMEKYRSRTYKSQLVPNRDLVFLMEVQTENLFDAAFYQLASLLTAPGKQIKLCPMCKKYFEPRRPNQVYCLYTDEDENEDRSKRGTCYAQKRFKQENRKK